MALSSVKKAFTAKPSYAGDPNCDFLAEACRKSTAKNAYQPDENLKTLIVNKINETTPGAQVPIKVTYDIIRRRLQMENPHKQWLAVDLTRHLLGASRERLRPYRTELLYHVARVAIKPNKKGPITAQHNARKAATDYLHQCGDEGQNALRMARMQLGNLGNTQSMPIGPMGAFGGEGAPPGYYSTVPPSSADNAKDIAAITGENTRVANVQEPTGDVMKDVRNLIDTAESHSSVLNELILAGDVERREANAPLLAELKQEMLQVKEMFPRLLEQLSMLKTPGSEKLMAEALEAHEQIDQCLDMERQYADGVLAEAELAKDKAAGHLQDDDDDDDEEEEEEEAKADDAAAAKEAAGTSRGDKPEASTSAVDTTKAKPDAAPAFDLLNFDSGPLPGAGASGAAAPGASGPNGATPSDDLFGLGALQSNLPGVAGAGSAAAAGGAAAPGAPGFDDPFMSDAPPDPSAAASTAPLNSNPFSMPTQAAQNGSISGQAGGAANPFGGNAFGQQPPATPPGGGAPSPQAPQPGQPPQVGQQFPGQQFPGQQFPGQQFPGQQQQGQFPGQQQPGQFPGQQQGQFMGGVGFTGGPTGPGQYGAPPGYMTGPTGGMPHGFPGQQQQPGQYPGQQQQPGQFPGQQMYGQQQQQWGAPQQPGGGHPFGGNAFPGQPQQFPGGQQQFPGGPQGHFGAPSPGSAPQQPGFGAGFSGGAPANPFAPSPPQQSRGMPQMQSPGPGFGASATGMPAPGYSQPVNPFAASSTGYGAPSWNPNATKDAFGDLIIEHNKRANPAPAMTAPMRGPGNGLL